MLSTRETPPDPSSHIVLTFTSATSSPVTTWKCDANYKLPCCKQFDKIYSGSIIKPPCIKVTQETDFKKVSLITTRIYPLVQNTKGFIFRGSMTACHL